MMEGGIRDVAQARRKAASRFGRVDRHVLPSDEEIGLARQRRCQLYGGSGQAERLRRMRRLAREAMTVFKEFKPMLVGDVLEGSLHANSAIVLQLFAEFPEQVIYRLHAARIPFAEMAQRRRSDRPNPAPPDHSGFSFLVNGETVELQVYPIETRLPSGQLRGAATKQPGASLPDLMQLLAAGKD